MSDLAEAASPPVPTSPPDDAPAADARAARLARFEREKLIVDYLNRGVPVADRSPPRHRRKADARGHPGPPDCDPGARPPHAGPAGRIRRRPGQPAPRGAARRLYSAMGGINLKTVDRVVKIVRELDRHHGLGPGRRIPESPRFDAPAQSADFGAALTLSTRVASQEVDTIAYKRRTTPPMAAAGGNAAFATRPENFPQSPEMIESAPGFGGRPSTPECGGSPPRTRGSRGHGNGQWRKGRGLSPPRTRGSRGHPPNLFALGPFWMPAFAGMTTFTRRAKPQPPKMSLVWAVTRTKVVRLETSLRWAAPI
jgi:hypothetical protein